MPSLLTDDWLEAAGAVLAAVSGPGGVSVATEAGGAAAVPATVQVTVSGAPADANATWWWRVDGDAWTAGPGSRSDAEVTVAIGADDLRAVLSGDLRLGVGFMQGRVKVDGPTSAVLRVLACTASARFEAVRRQVGELTT